MLDDIWTSFVHTNKNFCSNFAEMYSALHGFTKTWRNNGSKGGRVVDVDGWRTEAVKSLVFLGLGGGSAHGSRFEGASLGGSGDAEGCRRTRSQHLQSHQSSQMRHSHSNQGRI